MNIPIPKKLTRTSQGTTQIPQNVQPTKKMTKSWKLSIGLIVIAAILPMANDYLQPYGIVVTEAELQHYLYLAFGSTAIGAGSSIGKRVVRGRQGIDPNGGNPSGRQSPPQTTSQSTITGSSGTPMQ